MTYLEFRTQLFDLGCFSIRQVYAWQPDFDRNNLTRWIKKGLLVRLRQEYFAFSEYLRRPDFAQYIANRIYRPSYISLHTALSFYGLIPEAVVQITSVSTLKTATFRNPFGEYSYKSIKNELMFGYEPRPIADRANAPFRNAGEGVARFALSLSVLRQGRGIGTTAAR